MTTLPDARPVLLDAAARERLAQQLPGWRVEPEGGGRLCRRYVFKDFAQAFAFMTAVAAEAERHNHHPEWANVYSRVDIAWTTHDVKGLSTFDVTLATACDAIHARLTGTPKV